MTIAELDRYFKSRKRVMENEERRRASFDYVLGNLIGRSVARIYSSSAKYPTIAEAYPTLFSNEEIAKEKAIQDKKRFAAGLQAYAQAHNNSIDEEAKRINGQQSATS